MNILSRLILATSIVLLASCSKSQEDFVKNNIEEYIKRRMDDPRSFEFSRIELIDSVSYGQNINRFKKQLQYKVEIYKGLSESAKILGNSLKSIEHLSIGELDDPQIHYTRSEEHLSSAELFKEDILRVEGIEEEIEDILENPASYMYLYEFRGNNIFGSKALNSYIVQIGAEPDYKVLDVVYSTKEDINIPIIFPGVEEIKK